MNNMTKIKMDNNIIQTINNKKIINNKAIDKSNKLKLL